MGFTLVDAIIINRLSAATRYAQLIIISSIIIRGTVLLILLLLITTTVTIIPRNITIITTVIDTINGTI